MNFRFKDCGQLTLSDDSIETLEADTASANQIDLTLQKKIVVIEIDKVRRARIKKLLVHGLGFRSCRVECTDRFGDILSVVIA